MSGPSDANVVFKSPIPAHAAPDVPGSEDGGEGLAGEPAEEPRVRVSEVRSGRFLIICETTEGYNLYFERRINRFVLPIHRGDGQAAAARYIPAGLIIILKQNL